MMASGAPLAAMIFLPALFSKICVIMGGFPPRGYSCINLKLVRSSSADRSPYALCSAISIASNGIGSLAHIPILINAFSNSSASSGRDIFLEFNVNNFAKLILFSVIVPVLSVQITVALPNVSTVFICFTTIPIFISRQAPIARKVVNAIGISSGKILIAKVRALSRLSSKSYE